MSALSIFLFLFFLLRKRRPPRPPLFPYTTLFRSSTTAKSLEDLDWYVIENLPPRLLPTMVDLAMRASGTLPRIAAVIDLRSSPAFSTDLESSIAELGSRGIRPRVLFLESSDETLVRRFENVRRPHPLQEDGRVVDGIAAERQRLSELRAEA